MTIRFSSILILSAALLVSASSVPAAGPVAAQPGPRGTQHAAAGEVAALRSAFDLLRHADHDYKGHRVQAMHDIALACRLLGTPILPPGARAGAAGTTAGAAPRHAVLEPEPQSTSDAQLHQAQTILQQVLGAIRSGHQPRITALLGEANRELTTALSIK